MNPVPVTLGAPQSPQVNLLPPEVAQRRSASRARALISFGFILFLVLLAGAWFLLFTMRQAVEKDLAAEEERTVQLQAQLAEYGYIPLLEAQIDNARKARAWAGVTDVYWADQLGAFFNAVPNTVRFTSISVSAATPAAPSANDGTVFGVDDLGSLSFSGSSTTPIRPADLEDAIDAVSGFSSTRIAGVSISRSDSGTTAFWTFNGTTRISDTSLSGRTMNPLTEAALGDLVDSSTGDTEGEG